MLPLYTMESTNLESIDRDNYRFSYAIETNVELRSDSFHGSCTWTNRQLYEHREHELC